MITLKTLMAAGDDLLATRVLQGKPDWEALHAATPDDTLPGEDERLVEASDADDAADLIARMEKLAGGGLLDADAAAAALAAAWIEGAGE